MWQTIETAPKDGSLFIVWDGRDQMLGTWERTKSQPSGYLSLATPLMPLDCYADMPKPISWHPLPLNP